MKNRKVTFLAGAVTLIASAALLQMGTLQMVTAKTKAPAKRAHVALPKTELKIPQNREVATLAAGCFWSMEAIFKQLRGVEKVVPGYAGGWLVKPTYNQVCDKKTGHAEAIQVTYDPKMISYRDLLQVLLVSRDPTTLNLQGNDDGSEYRSAIFAQDETQKNVAQQAIREVNASHVWKRPIVTAIEPFSNFYTAEKYHFDYYNLHPNELYCAGVIRPEIAEFRQQFKAKLKR